jgi:hypothetical protein
MRILHKAFSHLYWADQRLLEALRRGSNVPAEAVEIYAHIVGAELVWLARLRREPAGVAVWPEADLELCASHAARASVSTSSISPA